MKKITIAIACMIALGTNAWANEEIIKTIESKNDFSTTLNKLKTLLKKKGLTHFDTIDHQANAKKVGLQLNPDTVVIFGNPKVGTLLMQCNSSLGIDLPLRILLRTNDKGVTTVSYSNPQYLKDKHKITDEKCLTILTKTNKALEKITKVITN